MPRQKKRIPRPTFRRKCHNCGKMATNPVVHHIVPSIAYGEPIPAYSKSAPKINRVDLKGDRKVEVYNYCNNQCYEEGRAKRGF
jgi:hypothetical protein